MIYEFIDNQGTFRVKNPQNYNAYFPLTNSQGSLLSSISPNLSGDIKTDKDHFITPPASSIDLKTNLLCRRDFFVRLGKRTLRLSYPAKDTLEAGFLYHKIIKKAGPFQAEILNFIPHNLEVEVMWVKLINKSRSGLKITPTSFIPLYGRSESNLRDHRQVSSLLNRLSLLKYGILLKPTMVFDESGHKANDTTYFCLGFEDKTKPPLGQFPTLEYFCQEQELINPKAIEKEVKPVNKNLKEFEGKEALAAFRFGQKCLRKNQEVNYFLITGAAKGSKGNTEKTIKDIFGKLNTPDKVKKSLAETKNYWLNSLAALDFDFRNKNFNNWLLWVKLQPVLRKLFGNSFLPHFDYGKGGRGWRDLSQDALTLLLTEPQKAKKIILNNFKGVRFDGSNATIITKEGNFLSDRNRIPRVWMDHGVWPYLALRLYINQTADLKVLSKEIPYFHDRLLNRAREIDKNFNQKDFLLRTVKGRIHQASLLEHILLQQLSAFFNVGKHNIIRLENADWNDGLDMASENGESVAFSFMYARNLKDLSLLLRQLKGNNKKMKLSKEILPLLDRIKHPGCPERSRKVDYNNPKDKQKRLRLFLEKSKNISGAKISLDTEALAKDLDEKTAHLSNWLKRKEWLLTGFFNGYYDNRGRRVEGKFGKKIRMMLPSQVFALMNGGLNPNQAKKTWASIKKYLGNPVLGGFRLNTDFGSLYLNLGRAFGFSYGDKENGSFFNHMVVMLAFSLYDQGLTAQAHLVLGSIYKMSIAQTAEIYPGIPEYFNNQGKGLYLYLTGSASWYIYTLFEKVLGIEFSQGHIVLKPNLDKDDFLKNNIRLKFYLGRKKIRLTYIKTKNKSGLRIQRLLLDGKKISTETDKYTITKNLLKKNNAILAYLG